MPRLARVAAPGVPHHVTQRGNNRQDVFFTDDDRQAYLALLGQHAERYGLSVWGPWGWSCNRRRIEDSAGLRNLLWDLENILVETDSGNGTVARYPLAPQLYGELVSQRRAGATSFHHFDALGSTSKPHRRFPEPAGGLGDCGYGIAATSAYQPACDHRNRGP